MRIEPALRIAAVTAWLPARRETAAEAVAAGLLDPDVAADNGYHAVSVSDELAAPELAVRAAADALSAAGWDPATVDLVVHAWTYYQGHDFWSPPHFVAHGIGALRAVPIGVQQMCNGGAAAIEVAAARLLADPTVSRAVVTTGDRFAGPGFDRWGGDNGAAYGDAGTALLLTRPTAPGHAASAAAAAPPGRPMVRMTPPGRPTFHAAEAAAAAGRPTAHAADGSLRLLATVTVAAPELEAMHRGADPFGAAPRSVAERADARRTMKQYFGGGGGPRFAELAIESMLAVLAGALAEARIEGDDPRLRVVALPRLGRTVLDDHRPRLASLTSAAAIREFGRDTGHLGAGDAAANLAAIHAEGLSDGDIAILLSVGAGFTWSAVVVQLRRP